MAESQLALRGRGLAEIKAVLDAVGLPFIIEGGALLGAVRQKDFLPWEDDVDVAVRTEDLAPRTGEIVERLETAGFASQIEGALPESLRITALKYDTVYQICGWYLRGRWRRRKHHKMPATFLDKTTTVALRDVLYPCPDPPVQYLRFFYGDWQTPRKDGRYFTYRCYDIDHLVRKVVRKVLRLR